MKKSIIIAAISAASAILLVSSCAKEELRENVNTGDGKVFTAVINQDLTKTTITSEYKVNWVEGDQIDINGSIFSATPGASDATKATFTKVSGSDPAPDYTAVYPASIMVGTQATLPATQTYAAGKFNAPMCAMSSTESLEFKNFCGVLCFALKGTDKVKSIAVTANEQICGPFEFADATSFSFNGENVGYTVTLNCGEGVQLDASTATSFYISLPPATYTTGMKIVVTSTEGKTFEKTTTKSATIARNQIYTFNWTASFSPAEPDCVEIGGIKWATKNLGAEKVTDYGDYFAWGETAPYYEGTGGWPATLTWKSGKESGYAWQSYCGSSSFSEWSTPPYDATTKILKADFDAATQILGDGWRMPTKEDFKQLCTACGITSDIFTPTSGGSKSTTAKGVYWCEDYDGVKGLLFIAEAGGPHLFFPASGLVTGTSLQNQPDPWGYVRGCYWSSSRNPVTTSYAYYFYFKSTVEANPGHTNDRCYGYSVRPVKDAAPAPTPTTTGTAKATIGGSQVDVNWVQLWENGPKFAEYNVGASSATDEGSKMTFTDATKAGAEYVWGANWCTPSKDQMDELLKAASSDGSTKVECNYTQENGVYGFKFTGKETDYTGNSVFFPAQNGTSASGLAKYWSSTTSSGDFARYMSPCYDSGEWYSNWAQNKQSYSYLVRPVLKN